MQYPYNQLAINMHKFPRDTGMTSFSLASSIPVGFSFVRVSMRRPVSVCTSRRRFLLILVLFDSSSRQFHGSTHVAFVFFALWALDSDLDSWQSRRWTSFFFGCWTFVGASHLSFVTSHITGFPDQDYQRSTENSLSVIECRNGSVIDACVCSLHFRGFENPELSELFRCIDVLANDKKWKTLKVVSLLINWSFLVLTLNILGKHHEFDNHFDIFSSQHEFDI